MPAVKRQTRSTRTFVELLLLLVLVANGFFVFFAHFYCVQKSYSIIRDIALLSLSSVVVCNARNVSTSPPTAMAIIQRTPHKQASMQNIQRWGAKIFTFARTYVLYLARQVCTVSCTLTSVQSVQHCILLLSPVEELTQNPSARSAIFCEN